MERMTSRNEDCVLANGHALSCATAGEIVHMAERLAAYEDTGLTPKDYMRLCFGMIDAADILFALPDAKESKGEKLEIAYCRYVGKGVLKWND